MSFDKDQFRELVRDVLKEIDPIIPYNENAVELIMLTVAQESEFGRYIRQVRGPAQGVIQLEPNTEKDIWINFIRFELDLKEKIKQLTGVTNYGNKLALRGNLVYQIILCRIYYYRKPESLPHRTNIKGMATYYKTHYNTYLGKATVEEAINKYKTYCL